VKRHIAAVALAATPILAGSLQNATRPADEGKLPLSGLVALGAVLFILAEVVSREPGRGARVLANVAVAAVVGLVGGALLAFALVGALLGASHGDPRAIEGSGSIGLAIIRQWWIFSAVLFVLTLVIAGRWTGAGRGGSPDGEAAG
jgi:hypothetical protein